MYLYAIDYPQYLRRFHGFALLDGQIRCMAPVVPLHAPPDLEAAITAWHHAAASRQGASRVEVAKSAAIVRDVAARCEWRTVDDINAPDALQYLANRATGGWGLKAHDNAVGRLRRFGAYLVDCGYFPSNPLDLPYAKRRGTAYPQTGAVTRPFTAAELAAVIRAAEQAEAATRRGRRPKGWRRSEVYRFLALTGLRYGEARSLRWSDVVIDGDSPRVLCHASWSKNRRNDVIPLAHVARDILAAMPREGPEVFAAMPSHHTLDADIQAAGIAKRNQHGTLGFHSFRKFLATELERAGVGLKTAAKITRHHDPQTLARVYMQPPDEDAARAVAHVASLGTNTESVPSYQQPGTNPLPNPPA